MTVMIHGTNHDNLDGDIETGQEYHDIQQLRVSKYTLHFTGTVALSQCWISCTFHHCKPKIPKYYKTLHLTF